jgi:hypothetical protein
MRKLKDSLDVGMDRVRKLQEQELALMGNRVTVPDRDAKLADVRAELARLRPIRNAWVRRRFFAKTPRLDGKD